MNQNINIDETEVYKFESISSQWWDKSGPCEPLHILNPARLEFIQHRCKLTGKRILDVGCGAGILSEGLAQSGAKVTGIDAGETLIEAAKSHAKEENHTIDYQTVTAEAFAHQEPNSFDIITCMELLEHVPDPCSLIRACRQLLKPNGNLFLSTLNRTSKAYLFAVLGAEYVLNILPKKTHDYSRFLKPSELEQILRDEHFQLISLSGVSYNPLLKSASLCQDLSINYLAHAVSKGEQ